MQALADLQVQFDKVFASRPLSVARYIIFLSLSNCPGMCHEVPVFLDLVAVLCSLIKKQNSS